MPELGNKPIQSDLVHLMNGLAGGLDDILNGPVKPKRVGFILMCFNFENETLTDPRCNYISNAKREDVIVLLREQLRRFEGQAEPTAGTA